MTSRALLLLAIASVGLMALHGSSQSYRYKLTLAVNTPSGVKRASSVSEVSFSNVSIPARGTMHKLHGEALYLDLGPRARPLIALLTHRLHEKYGQEQRWSSEAGAGLEDDSADLWPDRFAGSHE
jgi:hypothetical protein